MKSKVISVGLVVIIFIVYFWINTPRNNEEILVSKVDSEVLGTEIPNIEIIPAETTEPEVQEEIKVEEPVQEEVQETQPVSVPVETTKNYRMTSYYSGDEMNSTHKTGSGLSVENFEVNDKGWYTYQGKLVFATATTACLNSNSGACGKWSTAREGRHYFDYYEEFKVFIDDVEYTGIVLDSCGASMYLEEDRVDLFVSSKESTIDRGYKGNNPVKIVIE